MTKEVTLILDDLYSRGFCGLFVGRKRADTLPCAVSVVKKTSGFYRVQYGLFVCDADFTGVYGIENVATVDKRELVHWGELELCGFKKKSAVAGTFSLDFLKERILCKELTEGVNAIGFAVNIYDCLTLQKEGEEI